MQLRVASPTWAHAILVHDAEVAFKFIPRASGWALAPQPETRKQHLATLALGIFRAEVC